MVGISLVFGCKFVNRQEIQNVKEPIVLRVDFNDDKLWRTICRKIENPNKVQGFRAYVDFLESDKFKNKSVVDIRKLFVEDKSYNHLFMFLVDSTTINNVENPILCVSLMNEAENRIKFRVTPEEMWIIENNLSTSNLLFEELFYLVDKNGIFRGEIQNKR